jgi:hypothetical protein
VSFQKYLNLSAPEKKKNHVLLSAARPVVQQPATEAAVAAESSGESSMFSCGHVATTHRVRLGDFHGEIYNYIEIYDLQ